MPLLMMQSLAACSCDVFAAGVSKPTFLSAQCECSAWQAVHLQQLGFFFELTWQTVCAVPEQMMSEGLVAYLLNCTVVLQPVVVVAGLSPA